MKFTLEVIVKILRLIARALIITPIFIAHHQAFASPDNKVDASNLEFGLAYKTYSMALPYQESSREIEDTFSETLTSTGLNYGVGLELITAHNVDLSLSYEKLSHFKYDTSVLSFDAIWSF